MMGAKGVRQFVLWAEYEKDPDEYFSKKVNTGLMLNSNGNSYVVVEHLSQRAVEKVLKARVMAINVDKRFLDDIIAVEGREMYPELIGRIDNTLSHRGVLDAWETGASAKADEDIEVLLIECVGSARKAVGLKRVGGGFNLLCKADNLEEIEKMKKKTTGTVLDVGINTIIATLSKRKNARIGEELAPDYCAVVEKLLAYR